MSNKIFKNKETNKTIMFIFVQIVYLTSFFVDWHHTKKDDQFDNFDLLIHGLNTLGILSLLYYYYYHNIMDSFKVKFIVLVIVLVFNFDLILYYYKGNSQS
jgi:hypothetical protein